MGLVGGSAAKARDAVWLLKSNASTTTKVVGKVNDRRLKGWRRAVSALERRRITNRSRFIG